MKAFPKTKADSFEQHQEGMDLRDYFAAKAMQGFLTENGDVIFDGLAIDSYRVADAMMEARK